MVEKLQPVIRLQIEFSGVSIGLNVPADFD
jgi:hypothetical protein